MVYVARVKVSRAYIIDMGLERRSAVEDDIDSN